MTTPIEILKQYYTSYNNLMVSTSPSSWRGSEQDWKKLQESKLFEIKKAIDILEAIMQTGY